MISYDLAKELKDAGWRQGLATAVLTGDAGDWYTDPKLVYAPRLSELVAACPKTYLFEGDHFPFRLAWHSRDDTWVAGYLVVQCEDKTPEEAVARLWLKLKEGKV